METDIDKLDVENIQKIKPINIDTVHKICSGQVVLSLAVAVKELVENSLDAGATNIEVKLKNYGIDLIEISDNGYGVNEDNFNALTLKYHTSKLSEYTDLLGVSSFGFRGEALSSLCALASLTITTRHQSSQYATKIEYDYKGNIIKKTLCSRQVGTSVCLSNLFHSLPVRQKEFHKNVKREFNKMTQLLYAYCLISSGVKITCSNQTSSNAKTLIVATQGSTSLKDNIACVFGLKQLQTLLEIKPEYILNIKDNIFKGLSGEVNETNESVNIEDVEIDLSEDSNDTDDAKMTSSSLPSLQKSQGYKNIIDPIEFTGFVSSCAHGSGRSSTDRQFYYVNSRPCEPTKVMKLVNEIYKQYNPNQYPFVFLNINVERTSVDVNVTPDKRQIFLTKEKIILDVLKSSLLKLFENIPRTLKVELSDNIYNKEKCNDIKPEVNQPRIFNSFIQRFAIKCNSASDTESSIKKDINKMELKRKSTTMFDFISSKSKKIDNEENSNEKSSNIELFEDDTKSDLRISHSHECKNESSEEQKENLQIVNTSSEDNDEGNLQNETTKPNYNTCPGESINRPLKVENANIIYLESTDILPNTQIRNLEDIVFEEETPHIRKKENKSLKSNILFKENEQSIKKHTRIVTDKEIIGKCNRRSVNLKTSLDHVKALANIYHKQKTQCIPERVKFKGAINPVFNKTCEEELSKEISKDSFKQMNIVGQFNLGFIITQLNEDLFIIDQHATDEIYNFEILQKTTELTSQKLVIPQKLELSGVNEQILMDNLDIFKKNGFTFQINKEAQPTKRVHLLTIPMSKNWIFGKEDIEELLFILRESPSDYCRPSRVRAMFASRACRKSVMIGTALSKADMTILVDHMAEIDKPWNCPHGRPTIRHLVNLAMIQTKNS